MSNRSLRIMLGFIAGTSISQTIAQPIEPVDPQERAVKLQEPKAQREQGEQLMRAVQDRINSQFLSDEERSVLRVAHGQWTRDDLKNPALASQIALDVGDLTNPVFKDESMPIIDRAWASFRLGQADQTIALLDQLTETRIESVYLRASAIELLGRRDDAITLLESIETTLTQTTLDDPRELSIACEALISLTRLRSPAVSAKADYEAINTLIAYARDRVDRLDWRIRSVEAQLLYEHHNLGDAHAAAVEALRLNPRAAEPMLLLGHIAVDSFDFDAAERLASGLDTLRSAFVNTDPKDRPLVSAGGAILRARIALRRKDPEGAELALDPALVQYPNDPVLRALEASAAAAGYRVSSTNRLLERYDDTFPGSPIAAVWVGRTLSDSRQYEESGEVLRRAIQLAPNWGEPRLQLGLMLVQAGKDSEAREVLSQAMSLDPFNLRAQNSLTLLTELATYKTIETPHFIIRYKDGIDEVLAAEMPPILEAIHDRVCADVPGGMNHEPSDKTIIELMPNHEWFAVRIGGMPSIHTMAASTGPVIAFESPHDGTKSTAGPYDWARVLQHEYTHTVNLSRTRNRVIHWMTEANAVYNEDSPRDQRQWNLLVNALRTGDLFDLESINIAFVRPEKPTDRALAYAQGAWMFEYIIDRFGADAPRDIMDASTTGRTAPEAFEQVLGLTPDEFMDAFLVWAHDDLRVHGLLPAADLPSLDDLLDDPEAGFPSRETLDELIGKYPDHPDLINLRMGLALAMGGEELTDDQVDLLQEAIIVRPADETPHKHLARYYLASESFDHRVRAIPHLEFLDAREVHTTAYADQLSELYAQSGSPERALDKALRATRIAPFDPHAREQAARMALLNNDLDEAEHQLKVLIELEPDRAIHQRRLEALQSMREGAN